jgi:hypothetical protein
MASFKDTEDYTYEHRIIQEARTIISSVKPDGKIFGVILAPRSWAVLSMFSKVADIKLAKIPQPSGVSNVFLEFSKLLSHLSELDLTDKEISSFSRMLSASVNEITFDKVMLRNVSDILVLSLLFDEIVHSTIKVSATILNEGILKDFVLKIGNLDRNSGLLTMFDSLTAFYSAESVDQMEITPLNDTVMEGAIQLLMAKILSINTERQTALNIRLRRLLYVKQTVEKINLLEELKENIFRPSEQLIFSLLFSACVLVLLSFKKTVSLNYMDTLDYIDSQTGTRLVENELLKEREDATKNALTFPYSFVLDKLGIRWEGKLKLHQLIPIYFATWLTTLIIIYIQLFYLPSPYLVLITILLIIYIVEITVSISYQAYKKLK